MNMAIMFPVLPIKDITPISFYSREGHIPERNVNYEKKHGWTDDDIDYLHYYSMEHPTAFNGMAIHGVPTITQERVILRVKCLGETFESVVDKLKKGTFCSPDQDWATPMLLGNIWVDVLLALPN